MLLRSFLGFAVWLSFYCLGDCCFKVCSVTVICLHALLAHFAYDFWLTFVFWYEDKPVPNYADGFLSSTNCKHKGGVWATTDLTNWLSYGSGHSPRSGNRGMDFLPRQWQKNSQRQLCWNALYHDKIIWQKLQIIFSVYCNIV